MGSVNEEKLEQSLNEAFGGKELPFCHNPDYVLGRGERRLCKLSELDAQRCPALKRVCAKPVTAAEEAGGPWGSGNGSGGGRDDRSGEGRQQETQQDQDHSISLSVPSWLGGIFQGLFWLLVAAVIVAVVVAIVRMRIARRDKDEPPDETDSKLPEQASPEAAVIAGDKDVARLLEKARRAADRGDLSEAIDAAHAAAVQGLSAAQKVEVEPDRTNGDYLRDLRPTPALYRDFLHIVIGVERAQFGGQTPTRGAFDDVMSRVLAMLRQLAVLTIALVLALMAVGCGGGGGPQKKAPDPEPELIQTTHYEDVSLRGLYALRKVLSEQGTKVHLRIAPLKEIDDKVGTVLLYRRELEEEKSAQLMKWVRNGGSLVVVGSEQFMDQAELSLTEEVDGCKGAVERAGGGNDGALHLGVLGEKALRLHGTSESEVVQRIDLVCGGIPYAATTFFEDGTITFLPEGSILTNASLSVADNAKFLAELLGTPDKTLEIVGPWTVEESGSPMQSLREAGLLPIMLQLFALALLLAVRQGTSFGSRRDVKSVSRRAFGDHVRALASNYARAKAGNLASAQYGLLLVDQLRERLCPGQSPTLIDLASAIARRVQRPEGEIVQILVEAKSLGEHDDGTGVNHKLIRELEQLSAQAGGIS